MSGTVGISYGQIYVWSGPAHAELSENFGGQRNGLLGAALPGELFLITGVNHGEVGFIVELHSHAPPLDDAWEEIVEASFRPAGPAALVAWAGERSWPLDLAEIDYRVRYCGTNLDEEGERFLLQFWPAPPEPDRVVKETSPQAAYWHEFARKQPPPPDYDEVARLFAERQEKEAAEAERRRELQEWDGTLPSARLRRLRGVALTVARLDRPLVDALDELDPVTQRQLARWVIRRDCVEAGLADVAWIAPALAAIDAGDQLPPPFDDQQRAWDRLFSDDSVPHTLVTSPDGASDNCLQQAMAFPALFAGAEQDPLEAALRALWTGAVTFGHGRHGVLFGEVREVFRLS